jgi:hypothetical protein
MLRMAAFGCVALSSVAFVTLPAVAADQACGARDTVVQQLAKDFAERPVAMGLASNGNVIEVFNSAKAGTFTIVMTTPTGQSCLVAAGEGWEPVTPKQVAQGPDA